MRIFSIDDSTASRKFLLAILASAVITAVLSWLLYLLGSEYLSDRSSLLTDQSLASYIGVIFATAVALGGSLVAIVLADRAVTSANEQVELARQANQISEHQSPDGVAAVVAAGHYERLKGLLITVPSLLRKAHRDHLFDDSASRQDHAVLGELVDLITQATRAFLESTVPVTIVSLASRVDGSTTQRAVQHQRYFEYAISSLYYDLAAARQMLHLAASPVTSASSIRNVLLRVLHGVYALMREMDTLIVACDEAGKAQTDLFSALERKFIEQVLPVVRLNRDLWLTSDFDSLRNLLVKNINSRVLMQLPSLNKMKLSSSGKGGVIFSLHEGGHSTVLTHILREIRSTGAVGRVVHMADNNLEEDMAQPGASDVPVFLISDHPTYRLAQLQDYARNRAGAAWKRCVVLFDQVDQVAAFTPYKKRLSTSDAIACWQRLRAVEAILAQAALSALPMQDRQIGGLPKQTRDILKNVQDKQFPTGEQLEDLLAMVATAAQDASGVKPDRDTVFDWILLWDGLLRDMLDESPVEVQVERLKALDLSDEVMLGVVARLAAPPLLSRPFYHLAANPSGHIAGDEIDLFLDNAAVFGVAYIDTRFGVTMSPLLELLASTEKGHLLF